MNRTSFHRFEVREVTERVGYRLTKQWVIVDGFEVVADGFLNVHDAFDAAVAMNGSVR